MSHLSLVAGYVNVVPRSMASGEFELWLLSRYATGERDFRNLDLDERTHDFSRSCLAAADFSGSFVSADFREANLTGSRFNRCNVKTCDFRGANHMRPASFRVRSNKAVNTDARVRPFLSVAAGLVRRLPLR